MEEWSGGGMEWWRDGVVERWPMCRRAVFELVCSCHDQLLRAALTKNRRLVSMYDVRNLRKTPVADTPYSSITPSPHHSIPPSLHHSITPPLHSSIPPSLPHSITPPLHHPLLRCGWCASGYQCVLTKRLASSAVKRPVILAPMPCWKRRMAARVNGPKTPSAGPL
jgi:hypothetical protein